MKEGFQSLPNASQFVNWRVPRSYRSGVPIGRCFSNLIALQSGNARPSLRQELSASDSNHASTHNDDIGITWPCQLKA